MNLLVTGAWSQAEDYIPQLRELGHEVTFLQQEADPLICDTAWVEGIICNGLFLDHPLDEFPNLRYIQLTSAGFDRLDLREAQARGIEIYNARGVYSVPMAEFALAGVLAIYKRLSDFRDQQRSHEWNKLRDLRELAGKHVCIVGCGSVGQACGQRFKAFECMVVGIDLVPRELPGFDEVMDLQHLDDELTHADVVVVCVPLTEGTRGLVRADSLKPGAILVNISRGATVDLTGVQAAVLDVFDHEPLLADDPLWDRPNVILTPHNSFVGEGNAARLAAVILGNLRQASEGNA